MSEGGPASLFDVDPAGQLHSLLPQPATLVGTGTVGGSPVNYPGDIVLSPNSCRLLSSVGTSTGTAWVRVNRSDGSVAVLNAGSGTRIGYGFNGSSQLWADAGAGGVQRINEATGTSAGLAVVTPFGATANVQWVDLASNPCNVCQPEIVSDLGDAPDSTNHFAVAVMTAYAGVQAAFPTVFDPITGVPQGIKHWLASEDAWLGDAVTDEWEADLGPDADTATNIHPPTDTSNRDGADDGLTGVIALPHCQSSQFNYRITVAGPLDVRYTNVWFDFNRDGDWADTLSCTNGQGQQVTVGEWAVQNQATTLTPGTYTVTSSTFNVYDPSYPTQDLWMRISLTDAANSGTDGRGRAGGFEFGETEDYKLHPTGSNAEYDD